MSANSQNEYFENSYYVPNSLFNQNNIDTLKNSKKIFLDLVKCFYYENCSYIIRFTNWLFKIKFKIIFFSIRK